MIQSYFNKDSTLTVVKRDAKFYTRYVKGVPFSDTFSAKNGTSKGNGVEASPYKNLLNTSGVTL